MKEIGQQLKERREQMGLSIGEVSMAIKINAKVIQAIENADEANLPAKTFLRGFIRTYAKYLKLDADTIMKAFKDQMGSTSPEPTVAPNDISQFSESVSNFTSPKFLKKAGMVVALLGLVFAIVITKNIYEKYSSEKEARVEVNPPAVTDTEEQKPAEDQLVQSPEETLEKKPEENKSTESTQATTAEPPKQEEKPVEPEKKPEEKPVVETKPEEEKNPPVEEKKPPKVAEEDEEKPKPEKKPTVVKTRHEVIVEALDDVELDYRIDSGELKYTRLKPDQTFIIKAKTTMAIDVSNAGAVNIIYNGIDKGVPGDLGKTVKIRYP